MSFSDKIDFEVFCEIFEEHEESVFGLTEWHLKFGKAFHIAEPFIEKTLQFIEDHDCVNENPCGYRHKIETVTDTKYRAVGSPERKCNAFPLLLPQVFARKVNRKAIDSTIVQALRLSTIADDGFSTDLARTTRLGICRPDGVTPIIMYFTAHKNQEVFDRNIERLLGWHTGSQIIIATPTRRLYSEKTVRKVEDSGSALLPLAEILYHRGPRIFGLIQPVEKLVQHLIAEATSRKLIQEAGFDRKNVCVFKKIGDQWLVRFNGKSIFFKHFMANEMVRCVLPNPREAYQSDILLATARNQEILDAYSSAGEMIDEVALRQYKQRADEIIETLAGMMKGDDLYLKKSLLEELNTLQSEIRKAEGLRGRIRLAVDRREKTRLSVKNGFTRMIRALEKVHLDLAQHLEKYLSTGRYIEYRPNRPMVWMT